MHRIARILSLFAALVLPLQAVAGISMQLCRHDSAPQALQQATAEEHCPYHDAGATPAVPDQAHGQGCDDCGICHLACSGYMPAATAAPAVSTAAHLLQTWPARARASHIPEPPQYPPRRRA